MKHAMKQHDCKEELRENDLRITPARLGVLEVLEHTDTPVDVSTVIEYLHNHNIPADETTVFRILRVYTEAGLANPVQLDEGKQRFEYAGKPKHHHFVCEKCGSISDITECNVGSLEKTIERTQGVKIARHLLEFFGLCRRCRS